MLVKGSFEDFFYILIGIIWIAFSIYQGQKKRRQKSSSQPATKKKKSFFETLLDEVTEKNQQHEEVYDSEVEVSPAVEDVKIYEEKKFSYDDYYEERNYEKAEDVLIKNKPTEQYFPDQKLKSRFVKKRKSRFDLKKAVIYSEILKPKYF